MASQEKHFYAEQLRTRIEATLATGAHRVLLSDESAQWTGQEIAEKIRALRASVEILTDKNSFVGIAFPNSATQALAVLAVITSGRVPVMLSFADLQSEVKAWARRSQASLFLTSPLPELRQQREVPALFLNDQGDIDSPSPTLGNDVPPRTRHENAPDLAAGTALVLFTSGSTGVPKSVRVPAEGLLATVDFLAPYFGLGSDTVAPVTLPICHSMALNTQFLPTFLSGGRCHFMNTRLSLSRLYRTILDQRGTFVSLIGETLHMCWQERTRKKLSAAETVRHVQLAGGLIVPRHLEMAMELFPNALIHKGYGLTEAIRVTMIDQRDLDFDSSSVGWPLPFNQVEVRADGKVLTEPHETGEIHVKGPNVHLGTGSFFTPVVDARGYLATGDLGHWNARGQLCVLGRKDGQLRINGQWVSSFEIEKIALQTSSSIINAKCLAVADERRGTSKMVLLLEIPPDFQSHFLREEIGLVQRDIATQLHRLPHFPKEIAIFDRFPRTSNGKLAVSQLTKLYLNSPKSVICDNPYSSLQFFRVEAAA